MDPLREQARRSRAPTDALAWLEAQSPSTIRLGLDRVEAAASLLGHPERVFPSVHVAGTNGKGSVCALVDSMLGRRFRVGRYTSPHLSRLTERFVVQGREVTPDGLGAALLALVDGLPTPHELTYFEVGTLAAFGLFAEAKVDVAVVETGLGGRLDATTICRPAVTALTRIGLDHQQFLGDTLEAIAFEKAGILKAGVPVVCAAQRPEVLSVIEQVAERVGAKVLLEGRDFGLTRAAGGLRYVGTRWRLDGLAVSLPGEHQVQNAAVALACLEALGPAGFDVSPEDVRDGLRTAAWPGRLERLGRAPEVLLDGAHNPDGVEALLAALPDLAQGRAVHLVFGAASDKDVAAMLGRLAGACASVHLTPIPTPRSADPAQLFPIARTGCPQATVAQTPEEALAAARRSAGPQGLVLIAGSLFLVGALRAQLIAE